MFSAKADIPKLHIFSHFFSEKNCKYGLKIKLNEWSVSTRVLRKNRKKVLSAPSLSKHKQSSLAKIATIVIRKILSLKHIEKSVERDCEKNCAVSYMSHEHVIFAPILTFFESLDTLLVAVGKKGKCRYGAKIGSLSINEILVLLLVCPCSNVCILQLFCIYID